MREPGSPATQLALEVVLRVGADQPLGKIERLDQEEPVVVRRRERLVGVREHRTGWRDVEHGELRRGVRMIEAQPMRNASAAVVSYEPELRMAEIPHQFD